MAIEKNKRSDSTCSSKPRFNPHPENSELARAYEDGWRKGYLQSQRMFDHVTEVIEGARLQHEWDADPKSKQRSVIDLDELIRRDNRRARAM